ncbi:MAG: PAS domain-containing sensor histidine kinase [Pleurocapsa minor GSE-CHR-MK-17-07R]|jgi:PAS domain S-box-containing protein|nr:PAS domain-containing sensor histidine kinase [Pleurocapsa minor GSE-CHR-MK 17-07R]
MSAPRVSTEQLLQENADLRNRLAEAESTLYAIRQGEVDAFVVETSKGNQIYTLHTADQAYRQLVEQMQEGAVTLSTDGLILYCNRRFADTLETNADEMVSTPVEQFVLPEHRDEFAAFLGAVMPILGAHREFSFISANNRIVPVMVAANLLMMDQTQVICLVVTDLTDQRRMEMELRDSEETMRSIIENSMDAILLTIPNGKILAANSAATRMFGYSEQEIVELGRTGITDARDPRLKAAIEHRKNTGQFMGELTLIRKDGTTFPGEVSTTIFTNTAGELRTTLVIRDITQRKQAEEALQHSEARYRSLVNATSEGIVLHGADGRIESCNAAAERILGLSIDQMMGRTSVDPRWRAVHEDGSPFPGETHPAMVTLNTGQPATNVVMGVHKPDGTLSWILVNAQPIFDADDLMHPSAVVASFTDITDIKRVETLLKASETRFRTISEIITNYAYGFTVGADGSMQHEWTVGAFEEITGYTAAQMDERGGWAALIHPDDMPIAARRMKQLLSGKDCVDEFRIMTASNEVRWLRDYGRPQWDDALGRVTYIFGAAQDVTERRLLEQQAVALALEKQRITLLADFIRDTSHDLRTPLATITMSVYLAGRTQDENVRKAKLAEIEEQVFYLSKVLGQFQQMAILDSQTEIEPQPGDLNLLAQEAASVLKGQAKKKGVSVTMALESSLPVKFDANLLERAVTELLINAVRFTPEGGEVHVSTADRGDHVVLEVADNGIGIGPEEYPHIWERFFKVDKARTLAGGAGLGLPMVQRVAELHHGSVEAESVPHQRTVFRIVLPASQA